MIDDDQEMMAEELLASSGPIPEDEHIALIGSKDVDKFMAEWRRPPLPPIDPATDSLIFQQLDCDYSVDKSVPELSQTQEERAATARLFGITKDGNSVVAHVHGFKPYFWVRAPPGFTQADVPQFQAMLNAKVKAGLTARDQCENPIVGMQLAQRQSIMNYAFGQGAPFIRIITAFPSLVATCRRHLEGGMSMPRVGAYQFGALRKPEPAPEPPGCRQPDRQAPR